MTILLFEISNGDGYEYAFGIHIEYFDMTKITNAINKNISKYKSYYSDTKIEYRFDEDEEEKLLTFITKRSKNYLYLGKDEEGLLPSPSFRVKLLFVENLIKIC